jgi:carboxypeptidase C (cathepsin A)
MNHRRSTGLAVLTLLATTSTVLAQAPAAPAADSAAHGVPAESTTVTRHVITVNGETIHYTATAGNLLVRDDSDRVIGSFFYVAYTADGSDPLKRPITFLYNGGPGSSSIWLHMGSFGPVRVVTNDAGSTPPAPYDIKDNPYTLLDKSDLVFVDAMATGFSRIVGKGTDKEFFGTDPDIRSFADFITRYVTVTNRWNSPKFVLGESYGTTRSAGLANALEDRGIPLNGIVLLSSYLNAFLDFPGSAFALDEPYMLYLPTMAATAWYHDKLTPKPADLQAFLAVVRHFALNEYQHALAQGANVSDAERDSVVARLQQYTGIADGYWREADLRLTPDRFEKELLRGERRTVGRLDARFEGIDHDAAGESPEYDAADAATNGAFTTAFNYYVQNALHYTSPRPYLTTNYGVVGPDWDDHHTVNGQRSDMLDVAEDLRIAMTQNPFLQVFSANGYFDFATPFYATEYAIEHMGLDPSLRKNFTFGYYQSGHMVYLHTAALAQFKRDLAAFYDSVLTRDAAAR